MPFHQWQGFAATRPLAAGRFPFSARKPPLTG